MNRPLRRVAISCLLLFGILLVNVNIRQVVKGDDYRNDPGNRRVLERTYDRQRGSIALEGATRPLVARSLEQTQDDILTGESDELFTKRLSDTLTGRQPRGGDVVLTLQAAAQQAAASA